MTAESELLADLPKDWRNREPRALRAFAAVIGGRAVENKEQAIAVIEQALREAHDNELCIPDKAG